MMSALLLTALAAVSPARAAVPPARAAGKPVRLPGGPKSEDVLRRFVTGDPVLKARLDEAAKREQAFLAESRDSDLRDAVADVPGPDALKARLAKSSGAERAGLVSELPGMKAPPSSSCAALSDCAAPQLALDARDAEQLPDAVRELVRPWMLLQQARGKRIELTPVSGPGDAAVQILVPGLDAPRLTLNVTPRLLGGFKVWLDEPLVLAASYGRARDAVLKSSR